MADRSGGAWVALVIAGLGAVLLFVAGAFLGWVAVSGVAHGTGGIIDRREQMIGLVIVVLGCLPPGLVILLGSVHLRRRPVPRRLAGTGWALVGCLAAVLVLDLFGLILDGHSVTIASSGVPLFLCLPFVLGVAGFLLSRRGDGMP